MKSDNTTATSSQNVVIHLHPHFSHLVHSIKLSQGLFHVDRFTLLDSPNLQKAYSSDFSCYLETYKQSLETLLSTSLAFRRVTLRHILHSAFLRARNISKTFFGLTPQSLTHSTRDTIIRSRLCYLYSVLPSPLSAFVENLFLIRAKALLLTYIDFLRREKASLLVISHSTYSEYVALIEAAATLQIPILVLSGAVDRAWMIRDACEIYHITDKVGSLLELDSQKLDLNPSAYSTHVTGSSIYQLPSSSVDQKIHPKSCLLVAFHCFKDNNHVANPSRMLFPSYLAWTTFTCLFLAFNKAKWAKIVLKVHPHARIFQDLALFHLLTWLVKQGVNSHKIQILDFDATLPDLSAAINGYNLSVLTFQGSIAYEAVLYGQKPFVVGAAPVPEEACITISNKRQYRRLLSCDQTIHLDNPTTLQQHQQCQKLISIFESMKPGLPRRKHILDLKDYYFFGLSQPIDVNRVRKILEHAYHDFSPIAITLDSCFSIVIQG